MTKGNWEARIEPIFMITCSQCFLTDQFPGISFDDKGVCSICNKLSEPSEQERLKSLLELDRIDELRDIAKQIKSQAGSRNQKYDCIIGASGGFDSTYVVYLAKMVLGLNPLVLKKVCSLGKF
jgi:hypothetical protein